MRWPKGAQPACVYTARLTYRPSLRVVPRLRRYATLQEFAHNTMFLGRYLSIPPHPGKSGPAQERGAVVVRVAVVRAEAVATPGQYTQGSVGRSSTAPAAGVAAGRDAGVDEGASVGVVHAGHEG